MQRFSYLIGVCHIVLVPSAIAHIVDPGASWPVIRSALSCLALPLGIASAGHAPPDDWDTYYTSARAADGQTIVKKLWEIREFLRENIPLGETVLVDDANGLGVVAMADYHIVVPLSGGNGEPDFFQRRADLDAMLSPATPWPQRHVILKKYNIHYFYPTRPPLDWAQPHVERIWTQNRRTVIKFKME